MKTTISVPLSGLKEIFDFQNLLHKADKAMTAKNPHITEESSQLSKGTANDFYSSADYWWPNPDTRDGLPFVNRDGETYPGGFTAHRYALRNMRSLTAALAAGYRIQKNEQYAAKAVEMLEEFFLNEKTRMNPNLLYAQAIGGICNGRGVGIIDTLHLIDVCAAIDILKPSQSMTDKIYTGLRKWFADYLEWICTHQQGIEEMNHFNNHGICWCVQAACFAAFTENEEKKEFCARRFQQIYLPNQMAPNGSFPYELERTKPYSYSNFVFDNLVNICIMLSDEKLDLWHFMLPDGRCVKKGLDFIFPFVENIEMWPFAKDITHFEEFPAAMPYLLFCGLAYNGERYINAFKKYAKKPQGDEIRRNIAIREPLLWLFMDNEQ